MTKIAASYLRMVYKLLFGYLGKGLAMSVRSALYVLALVLAIAGLFILAAFGAISVLIHRNRLAGFSYLAGGVTTPKDF